jgi:hypothetical protein
LTRERAAARSPRQCYQWLNEPDNCVTFKKIPLKPPLKKGVLPLADPRFQVNHAVKIARRKCPRTLKSTTHHRPQKRLFVNRARIPCRGAAQFNKSPEPTAVGAFSSAIAVHVASLRWLSFLFRRPHESKLYSQPTDSSNISLGIFSGSKSIFVACLLCRLDRVSPRSFCSSVFWPLARR